MHSLDPLIAKYPDLAVCRAEIQAAGELLLACFRGGGKLLVAGNGGSAADSEHIVGELMKGYLRQRPVPLEVRQRLAAAWPGRGDYLADHLQGALPAISLVSQTALMTAFANDVAPDMLFAQQVYGYGRPGDALLAISTSGNASNILHAVQVARALGLRCLGLTGRSGGALKALCDLTVCVPAEGATAVQERHLPIYHALCAFLEAEFFDV
jgi:D-sedoheptulose 7-phosphate isomerase